MITEKLKTLPNKPGVYMFKEDSSILYIGKAKNIFKRVNQYFSKSNNSRLTKMINKANDLEIIVTNNEKEALILEHNLIKENLPPFNILLKDNKKYPYIYISDDKDPKITITRTRRKKGKFFGPFPDGASATETVQLLNRIFPLRKCRNIPKEPCLYYHIEQCIAPCIKEVDNEVYKAITDDISLFLKGETSSLSKSLKEKMLAASERLQFEQANELKKTISKIELFSQKQAVELYGDVSKDFIGYAQKNGFVVVTMLMIRSGKIIDIFNSFSPLIDDVESVIQSFLMQWYAQNEKPKTIVYNEGIDLSLTCEIVGCDFEQPTKGKSFDILSIANNSAISNLDLKLTEYISKFEKKEKAQLFIDELIGKKVRTIELFDNSHTMGEATVGAMVQFVNLEYKKANSRKFNINSSTNDDTASMREVVFRRINSLLESNKSLPDLIIVDGGKPQINAAKQIIDTLAVDIPIAGLAKNQKHRTNTIIYEGKEIDLKEYDPEILTIFGNMQDVIHRYAITFHRQKKRKSIFKSELENIEGLGKVRRDRLLKAFENINNIKQATVKELAKYVPEEMAQTINEYFKKTLDTK